MPIDGAVATRPEFAASRRAPRAVPGRASSYTDVAPEPPPLAPVLDIAALNARLQGVAARCFSGTTSLYVPFLALTANGQLYRFLQNQLENTEIVVYRPSGEGAPTSPVATVRRTAAAGDIIELDPVHLPGAYALKLVQADLNSTGFLRYSLSNPNVISISGSVQIESPPSTGGGTVDLTQLQTTADNIYADTQILKEREGLPVAQLGQLADTLAQIVADLAQTEQDLLEIPAALNTFQDTLLGSWEINTAVDKCILIYRNALGAPTKAYRLYDDQGNLNARKVFRRDVIPPSQWEALGIVTP